VLREKQEKLVKRSHSVVAEVVESEGDEKGEELTDNTPETRVKVSEVKIVRLALLSMSYEA
jgi:hypothetical protein